LPTATLPVILVALVVATAAGFFILQYVNGGTQYLIPSDVFHRLDRNAQLDAERLNNEPCNRTIAADLVGALSEQAEYDAIIKLVGTLKGKCGPNEDLLVDLFRAQVGSSDLPGAEETANQLAEEYPADPAVYRSRANVRERRGNIRGALADDRTALSLSPEPEYVPLAVYDDISRLEAKVGRPCDAAATLRDFIAFDPEGRRSQQLTTMIGNWQRSGSCPPLYGTGTAHVRYNQNARPVVAVLVNNRQAHMIIDTGADRTLLSHKLATDAGIDITELHYVGTANGETLAFGGRANSISIGDARLRGAPVFIEAKERSVLPEGIDGLLGRSFLRNFNWDMRGGSLDLEPLQ
jgi:clan AA aspartic protease (TIGR02281 family)